jgi:FMN phosphatase YigB (HAD superfamily)
VISAVLFDLYETLITEAGTAPSRGSSLAAALGLDDKGYRAEWQVRRPLIVRGQRSFADALTDISETLVGRADPETIRNIRQQRISEKAAIFVRMNGAIVALIAKLASQGVVLAVVSNGFEEDVIPWSSCPLATYFQCAAFSCVEHVAKPEAEIYLRVLRGLGVEPAAAACIGDGADDELVGAEAIGLRVGRAGWFVRHRPKTKTDSWPELRVPADVLDFVTAG